MNNSIFYNKVPEKWESFLPIGNGRLGAMVKTHPCNEIIQLNEEGIWSGGPIDRINPDCRKSLDKIRKLVKEGNVLIAQEEIFRNVTATTCNERVYQTAGELRIDFFSEQNYGIECGFPLQHKTPKSCLETYKAELKLDEGCIEIKYEDEPGNLITRTTWVSSMDDVIFIHIKSEKKGKINFRSYLDRGIWVDKIWAEDNLIYLLDKHGIPFCVGVSASSIGGIIQTQGTCLTGTNCDEVLIYIDIQSQNFPLRVTEKKYRCNTNKIIKNIRNKLKFIKNRILFNGFINSVDDFYGWHITEYQTYWNRFNLNIGNNKKERIPTPELLSKASVDNVELVNLYTNFSRYLLISGSRTPGKLPLTLQGLWNCYIDPPWGSKYTVNINAEMNYWPVSLVNLSECEIPFFSLLERGYLSGKKVAQTMYGCRGYVIHHNMDIWGDAAPQDAWMPGTYWVLGAAWMATHIWEHYEYVQDIRFLKKFYYLIHEACMFFVDFLVESDELAEDGEHILVINPTVSPENSYVTKTGQVGAICEGCEMDNMILEHLFKSCLKACSVLGKDCCNEKGKQYDLSIIKSFSYVLNHLKKPGINKDGSLMEWNEEVEETEPGHRHISHLYGLFPGHTISLEKTPELALAAKKTLEKRLSHGGGHTGWSQAWIINFRAQLGQGDEALEAVTKILKNSTLPNLLDNHPPFQIDGNFGSLAGIIRMLVQSEIEDDGSVSVKLLPALPKEERWQEGCVQGARIKGGYFIDFEWKDGKIVNKKLIPDTFAIDKSFIKFL